MGVITPKDAHALIDPKKNDALKFLPQISPLSGFKIEWIDVFVFFGRILGKLYASIWPAAKPFGVLTHVRMVWRALIGKVHGHFEAVLVRRGEKMLKIVKSAELR